MRITGLSNFHYNQKSTIFDNMLLDCSVHLKTNNINIFMKQTTV